MTAAALTRVDWIHLTVGETVHTVAPEPGIGLRVSLEPVPAEPTYGLLDRPAPPGFQVCVDLIPETTDVTVAMFNTVRCEELAGELATQLGAYAPAREPAREFSLLAAFAVPGGHYGHLSVPRLSLRSSGPHLLDEDQPLPGVPAFVADVRSGSGAPYRLAID